MLQYAIQVALEAHKGQKRKGTSIPYIVHPVEVGIILGQNGAEEEVIIAGILHDTVEDTDLTLEDIERMFGTKIRDYVEGVSEPQKGTPGVTWRDRKEHTIEYIKGAKLEVKLISCADKLSNIRSIYNDYINIGDGLWDRFNAGYDEQKWYYINLTKSLSSLGRLNYDMYFELCDIIGKVFGV